MSNEEIYMELNTEIHKRFPWLKPKGKNSINYWCNKAREECEQSPESVKR